MFKFKVPCDSFFDQIDVDGLSSGDDCDDRILNALGNDPNFPSYLVKSGDLSFEFQMTDLVPLWGYTKNKKTSEALVDFIANQEGEVPSELYHRIIYKV